MHDALFYRLDDEKSDSKWWSHNLSNRRLNLGLWWRHSTKEVVNHPPFTPNPTPIPPTPTPPQPRKWRNFSINLSSILDLYIITTTVFFIKTDIFVTDYCNLIQKTINYTVGVELQQKYAHNIYNWNQLYTHRQKQFNINELRININAVPLKLLMLLQELDWRLWMLLLKTYLLLQGGNYKLLWNLVSISA